MTPPSGAVERCPCGSGETYEACCGPRHDGSVPAPTAETLMRSRYTAFVRGDTAYLLATWHPSTRPRSLKLDAARVWVHLDVDGTVDGGPFADSGEVSFRAHYRDGGSRGVQRERSRFVRVRGRWYFLDAVARRVDEPGLAP